MSRHRRILILDDEVLTRNFLASVLSRAFASLDNAPYAIEVMQTGDIGSAQKLIEELGPFHLIFTDFLLVEEEKMGLSAIKLVKDIRGGLWERIDKPTSRHVPIVIQTGLVDLEPCKGFGANLVVQKPFNLNHYIHLVPFLLDAGDLGLTERWPPELVFTL